MAILTAKHVREAAGPDDGERLLVMRFWPRGVRRDAVDRWLRELAPSAPLLGRYRGRIERARRAGTFDEHAWAAFAEAYTAEMAAQAEPIAELRRRHEAGETMTLLCACHDAAHCHRTLLAGLVLGG